MRVLIYGAGPVGCVFGAFMARTGHDVTLLGRAQNLDVIARKGLGVSGIWGDYRLKAFELATNLEDAMRFRPYDMIVLSVKSYDTINSLNDIAKLMNEHTVLLSMQNGLGNIETILEKIPATNYLAGRLIFGATWKEPGHVEVTVNADDVLVGQPSSTKTLLSAQQMATILNNCKIPCRAVDDIHRFIWAKVIYNCALNAICTLKQIPYAGILDSEETRQWMRQIVHECYVAGRLKGIALEPVTPEAYIELLERKLIPATAPHYPSMYHDWKAGKRCDIQYLNGAITRISQQAKIEAPANEKAIHQIENLFNINR